RAGRCRRPHVRHEIAHAVLTRSAYSAVVSLRVGARYVTPNSAVIPAQAGTQPTACSGSYMSPGLRRDDTSGTRATGPTATALSASAPPVSFPAKARIPVSGPR